MQYTRSGHFAISISGKLKWRQMVEHLAKKLITASQLYFQRGPFGQGEEIVHDLYRRAIVAHSRFSDNSVQHLVTQLERFGTAILAKLDLV